jgi:hypothetical protein
MKGEVTRGDGRDRPSGDGDSELATVLEDYLAALETGLAVPLEQLLAEHPALAERLRDCLGGLRLVERAAEALSESPYPPEEAGLARTFITIQ